MLGFSAIIPVAEMGAANDSLQALGWGTGNFSVPAFSSSRPTFATMHAWMDPLFLADVEAIPNVQIVEGDQPDNTVIAACDLVGAQWGGAALPLPNTGMVNTGEIYWHNDVLWAVVQSFDRTAFPAPPETYPALMMMARVPGVATQWRQPLGSFDAYLLVEPFTGLPEQVLHNGKKWTNNTPANVWEPGVFGWTVVVGET